ncbi:MAG: putative nucleotide-diphospho-sugar transferase [Verrucomicrobiota bacterium]|jgi:hypothetical protein
MTIQSVQRGVVYIATGEKHTRAAIRSARSARKHCPELLIHLFSDAKPGEFMGGAPSPFDSWAEIENPHPRSKVDYMCRSPYDETLYLDSDTEIVADIREVFVLLEKFDMGLAHHVIRNTPQCSWKRTLPPCFPEFNSGVILFRSNPGVVHLLKAWRQAYHEAGLFPDQFTLRELLWESNLKLTVLPPEYNTMMLKYPLIWRKGEAVPKILHFRKYIEGRSWVLCGLSRALHRMRDRMTGKARFLSDE